MSFRRCTEAWEVMYRGADEWDEPVAVFDTKEEARQYVLDHPDQNLCYGLGEYFEEVDD